MACSISSKRKVAGGYLWANNENCLDPSYIEYTTRYSGVHRYTVEGKYIDSYPNYKTAALQVNGDKARIHLCAKPPHINVAYGFRWSSKRATQLKYPPAKLCIEVHKYDKTGLYVASYESLAMGARSINYKFSSHLSQYLMDSWRKAGGYYWRTFKTDKIEIPTKKEFQMASNKLIPPKNLTINFTPSPKQYELWKLLQPECHLCGGKIEQKRIGYDANKNPQYKPYCISCDNTNVSQLILGGGSARGGKSYMSSIWLISNCVRYPNFRAVIARKTLKSLKESTWNTILTIVKEWGLVEDINYKINNLAGTLTFWNDSVIIMLEMADLPSDLNFERFGSSM